MSHDWMKDTATWDDVEKACKLGAKWYEEHHKSTWSDERTLTTPVRRKGKNYMKGE